MKKQTLKKSARRRLENLVFLEVFDEKENSDILMVVLGPKGGKKQNEKDR